MKSDVIPLVVCLLLVSCPSLIGCGGPRHSESASEMDFQSVRSLRQSDEGSEQSNSDSPADQEASSGEELPSESEQPSQQSVRRIIYNANLRLVVKEFKPIDSQVRQLVQQHQGFLSSSNVDAQRGEYRSGNWVVRVPVENYSTFLADLATLGSVTTRSENAQDVTEEFVDLEARIANKKRLENRIVELLESRNDKIKDVIEVERELGRVREEIERMQGRMRYLRDKTSLATVTINVVQKRNYKPVASVSFGERISAAWADSTGDLLTFGKNLAIFCVAIAPWVIATFLVLTPAFLLLKRRLGRKSRLAAERA